MNKRRNAFSVALILSLVVSSNTFGMGLEAINANAPIVHQNMLFRGVLNKAQDSINILKNCVVKGYDWAKQLVINNPKVAAIIGATVAGGLITWGVVRVVNAINGELGNPPSLAAYDAYILALRNKESELKAPPALAEYDAYILAKNELTAPSIDDYDSFVNNRVVVGYDFGKDRPVFGQKPEVQPEEEPVVVEEPVVNQPEEEPVAAPVTTRRPPVRRPVVVVQPKGNSEPAEVCTSGSCKNTNKANCQTCNKSKGCTSCGKGAQVVAPQQVVNVCANNKIAMFRALKREDNI